MFYCNWLNKKLLKNTVKPHTAPILHSKQQPVFCCVEETHRKTSKPI